MRGANRIYKYSIEHYSKLAKENNNEIRCNYYITSFSTTRRLDEYFYYFRILSVTPDDHYSHFRAFTISPMQQTFEHEELFRIPSPKAYYQRCD